MKISHLLLIIILLSALYISACKKSTSPIVGTWTEYKAYSLVKVNGAIISSDSTTNPSNQFTLTADGHMISQTMYWQTQTQTYILRGDTMWIGSVSPNNVHVITELTDHRLILSWQYDASAVPDTITYVTGIYTK